MLSDCYIRQAPKVLDCLLALKNDFLVEKVIEVAKCGSKPHGVHYGTIVL